MAYTDNILDAQDDEYERNGKMIVARVFSNDIQANLCASALHEAGIHCYVSNEVTQAALIGYGNTTGVRLHIHEYDIEAAQDVFDQFDASDFSAALVEEVNEDYNESSHSRLIQNTIIVGFILMICIILFLQYAQYSS